MSKSDIIRMLPEKKVMPESAGITVSEGKYAFAVDIGRNQTIDASATELSEREVSVEEFAKDIKPRLCNMKFMVSSEGAERIAKAILKDHVVLKKVRKGEQLYPCNECGVLRTKAEGGTTFTVCDKCWDKGKGEK